MVERRLMAETTLLEEAVLLVGKMLLGVTRREAQRDRLGLVA
jgi:hypothetical protein